MGPFALTIQVGASHSILTSTETILSLSSKNSQSSQKGLLRSFTTAARNLTLMERIQRGITIENGKARAWLQCASSTATERRDAHAALTSARTRTRFVDIYAFVDSRSRTMLRELFPFSFVGLLWGGSFWPEVAVAGTHPKSTDGVCRPARGVARVSLTLDVVRRGRVLRCSPRGVWRFSGCFICFFWLSFFGAYF